MSDIASLSLEIDSTPITRATAALNDFTNAGDKAEAQTVAITQAQVNANYRSQQAAEAFLRQREAVAGASDEIQKILNRYDPLGTKLRQLQTDFAALEKAIASGATGGTGDLALDKSMKSLNDEIAKTKGLMEQAGAGTKVAAGALDGVHFSSMRAQQSLMHLGREVMSGDFAMMPTTLARVAMHMGRIQLLLNPLVIGFVAVAASVGAVAVAVFQGTKEMNALNTALEATHGFSGMTRSDMAEIAAAVSATSTLTIGAANAIVTSLIASGRYTMDNIGLMATAVENYAHLTGESAEKVLPKLMKMFEDPAKASEELNKQYHYLEPSELRRIQTLEQTGQKQEAVTIAVALFNAAAPDHAKNIGMLAGAWEGLHKGFSAYWNDLKAFVSGSGGLDADIARQIARVQWKQDVVSLNPKDASAATALATEQVALRTMLEQKEALGQQAKAKQFIATLNEAEIAADKISATSAVGRLQTLQREHDLLVNKPGIYNAADLEKMKEQEKQMRDIVLGMGAEDRAMATARLQAQEKLYEVTISMGEDELSRRLKLNQINKADYDAGMTAFALQKNMLQQILTLEEKRLGGDPKHLQALDAQLKNLQAQSVLIAQQGASKQDEDAYALKKANADLDVKAMEATITGQQKVNDGLVIELEKLKEHNAEIGKTKEQIDELRALEMDRRIAKAQGAVEDAQYAANDSVAGQAEAERLRVQLALLKQIQDTRRQGAAIQAAADTTKRETDDYMKMFGEVERQGKAAFVAVMGHGESAAKAIGAALKTSVIDLLYQLTLRKFIINVGVDIASSMGINLAGTSLAGVASSAGNGIFGGSGIIGNVINGGTTAAGAGGWVSAEGGAGYLGGAAADAGAMSIASAVPWIAAAVVAYELFASKGGGPQVGQYGGVNATGYTPTFTMSGGDPLNAGVAAKINYNDAQTLAALAGHAGALAGLQINQGYKLDPQGSAAGVAYRSMLLNGRQITPATFDGNNGANLVTGSNDSAAVTAFLGKLSTSDILALVKAIGDPVFSATVGKLAQNFDDLGAALTAYTQAQDLQKSTLFKLMTADQQHAATVSQLQATFESLGQQMPSTREGFMALINALDLTTQSGMDVMKTYSSIADAFIQVTDVVAAQVRSLTDIANERKGLQDQLDQLTMTSTQLLEKQRDAIDASNLALFDQVQALEAQKAAVQAATSAASTAVDAQLSEANKALSAAQNMADTYHNLAKTLTDTITQLRGGALSPLNPAGKYAEGGANVETLYQKSLSHDAEAAAKLPQAITDWLNASRVMNASGSAYTADFNRAMKILGDAGSAADAAGTAQDSVAGLLQSEIDVLGYIRTLLASPSPDAAILQTQAGILGELQRALTDPTYAIPKAVQDQILATQAASAASTSSIDRVVTAITALISALTDQATAAAISATVTPAATTTAGAPGTTAAAATASAVSALSTYTWADYRALEAQIGPIGPNGFNIGGTWALDFQSYWRYGLHRDLPNHAMGLDRVPYDNYVANLHRDEAVLSAPQAANWRGGAPANDDLRDLLAEVKALREEVSRLRQDVRLGDTANVQATKEISRTHRDLASRQESMPKVA